ncbi:hypothetical protein [Peribacillus muralis]|uniref:hypothetical protein n=1 Tax=Peribacillus muralis TaxID=264697 RepID=UPI00366C0263
MIGSPTARVKEAAESTSLQNYGPWRIHPRLHAQWNETEGCETPAENAVYVRHPAG